MSRPRQSDRAFGLLFTLVFAVIATVAWTVFDARLYWAAAVAVAFLVLALAAPRLLMPLNRLWGALSARLDHVSNYLVLGLFFGLFIVPAALIMRLLGRDPLHRRFDEGASTYLVPVKRHTNAETLPDMF